MSPIEALRAAINKAGSQSAFAEAMPGEIKTGHVYYWLKNGLPADHCPHAERISGGEISVEMLAPDVRWTRVPDRKWPHPKGRPTIDPAGPVPKAQSVEAASSQGA